MPTMFNEDNTIEQMMISALKDNGWKYIPAENLPRLYSDVLVEPMVKDALIRLNPEIAEDPSRADEVIYKLRTVILSVQAHNLVTQNEILKKMIFEENSYPFGKDGRMIADIDSIVKIVRFDGWQNTTAGKQEVKKALRSVVWIKYKIKDKEVFDRAYSYIEQYY